MSKLLSAICAENVVVQRENDKYGIDMELHPLDLNIWAGREVLTADDFLLWVGYAESFSDCYKDANGFRPRFLPDTLSEFVSYYESFDRQFQEEQAMKDAYREVQIAEAETTKKALEKAKTRDEGLFTLGLIFN